VIDLQLMPGLSVNALMSFCPMVAALMLVHQDEGAAGVKAPRRRAFDLKRIKAKRWYAPILLLMAGVNVAVYGLMQWMGMPLPALDILVPACSAPQFLLPGNRSDSTAAMEERRLRPNLSGSDG